MQPTINTADLDSKAWEPSNERIAEILDNEMPAILDDGFEEPEIVRVLAAWRVLAANDERRSEQKKPCDKKLAQILYEAATRLETLLEETADDLFDDSGHEEESDENVVTPATKISEKNPGLLNQGLNSAELTKRLNQTGRNEPCPCESGKKFKKCCGAPI